MGASSWHYFTPYHPDPEAALQRLRQEVFESGRYGDGFSDLDPVAQQAAMGFLNYLSDTSGPADPREQNLFAQIEASLQHFPPAVREQLVAEARERVRDMGQRPASRPSSIDELLEKAAEEGTHSILDITHVAARPDFGAATPLPPGQLRRFFETDRPTRQQAEEVLYDLAEDLDRWQAYYFTVYKDGEPSEYAFVGCSGD